MKFYVDQALGSLIKWLRFLGFDAEPVQLTLKAAPSLPPAGRNIVILTRQTALPTKLTRPDVLVLTADGVEAQVAEICRRLQLSPETWQPLKRCSTCNDLLQPVPADQAEGRVPEFTRQRHRQFFECPRCRRLFWEGSHLERIRRHLEKLQEGMLAN